MNALTRLGGAGLLAALLLPSAATAAFPLSAPHQHQLPAQTLIALGGGRPGGGGGLRSGGVSRPSAAPRPASRPASGFQNAGGGLTRGDRAPAGGWSHGVNAPQARPSLSRPAGSGTINPVGSREVSRPAFSPGQRDGGSPLNRGDAIHRDGGLSTQRSVNRNWSRTVNVHAINVHPGWARPGWGVARPWSYGWYGGWSNPPWGWWGARAAVWGIGTLATAAVINNAVDAAINNQVTYIVVPNSSYQLLYGSVAPSGNGTISFAVTAEGSTYQLSADCQAGTLNGATPASAAEAELLNAACQVAFGST
jgi:hypothetical protein